MDLQYPIPERANRSILWMLAAALLIVSLALSLQSARLPVLSKHDRPAASLEGQPISRPLLTVKPLPIPEPPYNQKTPYTHQSSLPLPMGTQLIPAPLPVPTPPPGQ
jgi:hypothetical protein